jgi:hypothetical protein
MINKMERQEGAQEHIGRSGDQIEEHPEKQKEEILQKIEEDFPEESQSVIDQASQAVEDSKNESEDLNG